MLIIEKTHFSDCFHSGTSYLECVAWVNLKKMNPSLITEDGWLSLAIRIFILSFKTLKYHLSAFLVVLKFC